MARDSRKCRRICIEDHGWDGPLGRRFLTCHVCKRPIDLLKEPDSWRADHIRRKAEGGEDTAENLRPICLDCDCGESGKAANDTREVARGKRIGERHWGAKRSAGFRKAPEGYRYDWKQRRITRISDE